jgi:hypothetical protein
MAISTRPAFTVFTNLRISRVSVDPVMVERGELSPSFSYDSAYDSTGSAIDVGNDDSDDES